VSWEVKPLGDLCDVLDHKRKPVTKSDRVAGPYPYYGATGILDYVAGYLFDEPLVLVGEDGAKWGPGEKSAFPVKGKVWVNNHAHVLRPHRTKLVDNWLIHYLNHSDLMDWVSGVTVPKLNQGNLRDIPIPVPPLHEQQRIVGILDEAFAGIATAKANAEKNLRNARELFESELQAIFADGAHRDNGWVDTTIGERIKFIDYRGKTPVKTANGLRLITAKNVKTGYVQETPVEYVSPKSYDAWMTRGIPQRGDVLFTTEAPLANVAQLDTDEKVVFAQRIIIMQPDRSILDPTFLKYLLLSQPVQQRIRTKGTGATVQGIKASLLRTIEISFPKSLTVQQEFVAKLDALVVETERLESLYEQKFAALDALKKSLLHQAFSGQLVPRPAGLVST
jgi:type I restriction enzyme, S subunit